jgi:hypothetical protein
MSRIAIAAFCVLTIFASASPLMAQAGPVTAEGVLDAYKDMVAVPDARCAGADPISGEILVCGKRDDQRARLPLPGERDARDGERRATGDMPGASAARMRTGSCGVVQTGESCTGGLSVMAAAGVAIQGIKRLIDPDGAIDPPPIPGRK